MKSVLVLLCLVFNQITCEAQSNKLSVTLNPFSFLEPDAGFTPGLGYVINKRLAVFSDFGYIFYSPLQFGGLNNGGITTTNSSGLKIKPALRYYLEARQTQRDYFIEVEGLLKLVNYDASEEIDVVDNNGNFAFTYIGGYKIRKNVAGLNLKFGYREFFGRSRKLGYDIYAGLGFRNKKFKTSGLPQGVVLPRDPFSSSDEANSVHWQRGTIASIPLGLKIFYNL